MIDLQYVRLKCPVCGDTCVRVKGTVEAPRFFKHEGRERYRPCAGSGADASAAFAVYVKARALDNAKAAVADAEYRLRQRRDSLNDLYRVHALKVKECEQRIADGVKELDEARAHLASLTPPAPPSVVEKPKPEPVAKPDGCICDYPEGNDGVRRHRFGCATQGRVMLNVEVKS